MRQGGEPCFVVPPSSARRAHLLAPVLGLLLAVPIATAVAGVDLGAADSFALLAGSGITNAGASRVVGDVGSHPTGTQTGFGPGADSVTILGTNHHADAATQNAKAALANAMAQIAARPNPVPIPGGELGGLTLAPGHYSDDKTPASLALTGTLTLDGLGFADSVFILQSATTLVAAEASQVILTHGAQACNVYWLIGTSATLGGASHVQGALLAKVSIAMGTAATITGRALALDGAVTMQANSVSHSSCTIPTPPLPEFPAAILVGAGIVMIALARARKS